MSELADLIMYSQGMCYASVCTTLPREQIADHCPPSGTSLGWQVSDEDFQDGTKNGSPCPDLAERRHWLVEC
jgi:hypothetical protein